MRMFRSVSVSPLSLCVCLCVCVCVSVTCVCVSVCVCMCVSEWVCVCVCVCTCERERKRERSVVLERCVCVWCRPLLLCVCVCVCVCVRERERERERERGGWGREIERERAVRRRILILHVTCEDMSLYTIWKEPYIHTATHCNTLQHTRRILILHVTCEDKAHIEILWDSTHRVLTWDALCKTHMGCTYKAHRKEFIWGSSFYGMLCLELIWDVRIGSYGVHRAHMIWYRAQMRRYA